MASLTFANIETRCANHLRLPTSNTTEMTKLDAIINEVYRDVGMAYPNWWWLRKHAVVNTVAVISTGTLAATKGSATITFSSGPSATAAGKVILVTANVSDPAAYRISTHTAGATTATLEAAYTGTTVTASAYKLYQDRYDLPTDLKALREARRYGRVEPLRIVGPERLDEAKIIDTSEGTPTLVAIRDFSTTGDPTTARSLIVHPYPDDTYQIQLEYLQTLNTEVAGTTRLLIPDDYVQVLIYGVLSRAYPVMLSDAQRGLYYAGLYNKALDTMIATQRQQEGFPTTVPADTYRRFYHRERRRGHSTLRSQFERWPSEP